MKRARKAGSLWQRRKAACRRAAGVVDIDRFPSLVDLDGGEGGVFADLLDESVIGFALVVVGPTMTSLPLCLIEGSQGIVGDVEFFLVYFLRPTMSE